MATLEISNESGIDILQLSGDLGDPTVEQLRQQISNLRKQNSTKLLLLGDPNAVIRTRKLGWLESPVRHYRMLGGVIALAEFEKRQLHIFQNTLWYRYINCFQTTEEAKSFLLGDTKNVSREKRLTPIIHDVQSDANTNKKDIDNQQNSSGSNQETDSSETQDGEVE